MSLLALALLTITPPDTTAVPLGALPWRTIRQSDGGEVRYALPRVTDRDYPPVAKRVGIEGTTLLALEVNPDGQIISCKIIASAGLPLLDARACEIYHERARFEVRGIKSNLHFQAPVTWKLLYRH